jgi:hypothetical protein
MTQVPPNTIQTVYLRNAAIGITNQQQVALIFLYLHELPGIRLTVENLRSPIAQAAIFKDHGDIQSVTGKDVDWSEVGRPGGEITGCSHRLGDTEYLTGFGDSQVQGIVPTEELTLIIPEHCTIRCPTGDAALIA